MREGYSSTAFCPIGLDEMPVAAGFEQNMLSEYPHNVKFRNHTFIFASLFLFFLPNFHKHLLHRRRTALSRQGNI